MTPNEAKYLYPNCRTKPPEPDNAVKQRIVTEILKEREYQDKKWGGAGNDDKQGQNEWCEYIFEYAGGSGRGRKYDFRTRMVKVAALAIAAIESTDRKSVQNAHRPER